MCVCVCVCVCVIESHVKREYIYMYVPNGLENHIKNVVYKHNFDERVGRETGSIDIVGFEIGSHSRES